LACPTHPPRPLPVSTALAAGPTGPRGIPSSSTPFRAPPSEAEPPDDVPRPTGADRILPRGIVRRAAPHGLRTLFPPGCSPSRQASPVSSRAAFLAPRCRGATFRTLREARTGVRVAEAPRDVGRGRSPRLLLVLRLDRAAGARWFRTSSATVARADDALPKNLRCGHPQPRPLRSPLRPSIDITASRPLPGSCRRTGHLTLRLRPSKVEVPFRPRGFSPPRRLSPRLGWRACCIPLPILGFAPFPRSTPRRLSPTTSGFRGFPGRYHPSECSPDPQPVRSHLRPSCPLAVVSRDCVASERAPLPASLPARPSSGSLSLEALLREPVRTATPPFPATWGLPSLGFLGLEARLLRCPTVLFVRGADDPRPKPRTERPRANRTRPRGMEHPALGLFRFERPVTRWTDSASARGVCPKKGSRRRRRASMKSRPNVKDRPERRPSRFLRRIRIYPVCNGRFWTFSCCILCMQLGSIFHLHHPQGFN
jgi:hypothetical protein